LTAAPGKAEIVFDLAGDTPEGGLALPGPAGAPFSLRFVHVAPAARYHITVTYPDGSGRTGNAGMGPVYVENFARGVEAGKCLDPQKASIELLRSSTEAQVVERLPKIPDPLPDECVAVAPFIRSRKEATETVRELSFERPPAKEVPVVVERYDPETNEVLRRWRLRLQFGPPPRRWAYRNEEAWIVGETARDHTVVRVGLAKGSVAGLAFTLQAPAEPMAVYQVRARLANSPPIDVRVQLDEHVWSPQDYSAVA
jgi:hypothetical protein